jgi:hypothetical protein
MCDVEAPTFFRQSAHRWRCGFQPYAPAALYLRQDLWYSFLLKAEWPQGHSAAERIESIGKSKDHIGNRTRNLPACSTVPQAPTLPRAPRTARSVTNVRLASESVFVVHPVLYAAVPLAITLLDNSSVSRVIRHLFIYREHLVSCSQGRSPSSDFRDFSQYT